jgi:hypothetical protein
LRSIRGRRSAIAVTLPSKKPARALQSEGLNEYRRGLVDLMAPHDYFIAVLKFMFSVVTLTARLLKYPLPLLLSLYILTSVLARISMDMTATVCSSPLVSLLCPQQQRARYSSGPQTYSTTRTPHASSSAYAQLCSIPIIGLICPRPSADDTYGALQKTDISHLVGAGEEVLGVLLNGTMRRAGLSTQLRRADMAAADLLSTVQQSSLSSRDEPSTILEAFSDEARALAWQVQDFDAHVAWAADE